MLRSSWFPLVLLTTVAGCGAPNEAQPPMQPYPLPASPGYPQPGQLPPGYPQPQSVQPVTPPLPGPVPMPGRSSTWATPEEASEAIDKAELELSDAMKTPAADPLASSQCVRSCKALGSMRRAVDRLCELTGDDDERCENAQTRLEASEQKVRDAGCSC